MVKLATKSIVAMCLVVALSACTSWRMAFMNGLLGSRPGAAQQPVDAEVRQAMQRLHAQGAAALSNNDLDAAIAAWREYAAIAPVELAQTRQIRGFLTLLDRESARRYAKQVSSRERAAPYAPGDRLHVALFPFTNLGPNQARLPNASFNRAVMSMITTDLARVPSLTVLEREKVDYLVQELKLADSGITDPATVIAQGRMLGAGTVIVGSVYNEPGPAGPGSGRYRINTAVSDVADGRLAGAQEADGGQAEFFNLQKRIVYGILDTLGIKDFPSAVRKIHTRSWAAYAQFARGLMLLDADRFDEARSAFRAALEFDPAFALAEEALLNTPAKAASLEEIKAMLRAGS